MSHHYQSESIGALAAALAKAQGEMQAASKDANNPHFKSRYADLASITEACRAPLSKHGLAVSQLVGRDEAGAVTLTTLLMHASGEHLGTTVTARPAQENPQVIGSIVTYLRRYALAAIVGVVSDDDDGEAAAAPARSAPPRRDEPPAAFRRDVERVAQTFGGEVETMGRTQSARDPACPKCSGPCWDNRAGKRDGSRNAKSPDFSCKNKECGGAVWKYVAPQPEIKPPPPEHELPNLDDTPF